MTLPVITAADAGKKAQYRAAATRLLHEAKIPVVCDDTDIPTPTVPTVQIYESGPCSVGTAGGWVEAWIWIPNSEVNSETVPQTTELERA